MPPVANRISNLGLLALAGWSAPALAQETVAADRVVVAATRQVEDVRDIPQTIAILTSDDLSGVDGAEDIVRRLVGVQAAVSNGSQTTFQIRGVGAVDHQALTPGAAAVHVDGVFLATNVQASLLAYDLARVEVLKGPQGAIQGRNASSGSLNFFSQRPTDSYEGYADLSYGRFNRRDVQAAVSGPLGEGVRGRLAVRALKQDPTLENVGGPGAAGGVTDEIGARASLEVDLPAAATLLLRAHYESDQGVNPAPRNSTLDLGAHQISVGDDGIQDTDNRFYGLSAEINGRAGEWRLTSLTAVEGFAQDYGFDFDGLPAAIANLSYDRGYYQVSQEFYGRTRTSHGELLLGASFARDDFEQDYLIWCGELDASSLVGSCAYPAAAARVGPTPASSAPAASLLTHIEQVRNMAAVYAVADFEISDQTTLTLGGRYTTERIEGEGFGQHIYADGVRALNNRGDLGLAEGANDIDEGRFTGLAALQHRFGRDLLGYLSFGQGYKSGGFNGEVANNATHYQDEGLFRAETVDAWELGLKGGVGDALTYELSAFRQTYDAPQARIFVSFPLPGGGAITSNSLSNLDRAIVEGAEASALWRPYEGAELGLGLIALDTRIDQTTEVAGATNVETFNGNPLPFASDFSATLHARQEWMLSPDTQLALELNVKHQGAYYLDAEGRADRRQDPLTLLDAALRLGLRDGLEVSLWGRNLTDEDYALSGYGFIGYDTFRSQPASWGVSVRQSW